MLKSCSEYFYESGSVSMHLWELYKVIWLNSQFYNAQNTDPESTWDKIG